MDGFLSYLTENRREIAADERHARLKVNCRHFMRLKDIF